MGVSFANNQTHTLFSSFFKFCMGLSYEASALTLKGVIAICGEELYHQPCPSK
jgi:hypothetical protein